MKYPSTRHPLVLGVTVLLLIGCAPGPPSPPAGDVQGFERQSTSKVLTMGIDRELDAWNTDLIRVTRGGGIQVLNSIGHNRLVVQTETFSWVPELALEQISIERGTWQLRPDNTMATTWRLPHNAKWHDGAPFTADDFLFTFTVMKDPGVPNTVGAALRVMEAA